MIVTNPKIVFIISSQVQLSLHRHFLCSNHQLCCHLKSRILLVNDSTCDLHTTTHEMVVSSSYLDEGSQLIHKYFSTFTVMQGEDGY